MVKRMVVVLLTGAFLLTSCFATRVAAPPGAKNVKLAPRGSACTEVASKRQWYALWGLVSLSDKDTGSLVQGATGPVQVETKFTVVDYLIGIFTSVVTIYPKTVKLYVCK